MQHNNIKTQQYFNQYKAINIILIIIILIAAIINN